MKITPIILGLLMAMTTATPLRAQVSAFTYQGRLNLNGAPANGFYDFMFRLLNDPTNAAAAPVIPINLAVPVTNGLFTTGMDFGAENFDGANRWLEINVRTNGGGSFTTLSPRQFLTPTPYAIAAHTASNLLGPLPANRISGTILNASLPASPNFSGTLTANNFSGNGANLTDVNATTLGGLNSSNFWRTTGNAGIIAGTHFLGTTDNQPLELKVNGQRSLRFEIGGGGFVNVIGGNSSVSPAAGGATVAGGSGNAIERQALFAAIGGGYQNVVQANAEYAVIGGGFGNVVETNAGSSTIAGGSHNRIQEYVPGAAIGGGGGNTIGASHSTIAGGGGNMIQASGVGGFSFIGGGFGNEIQTNAPYACINGGSYNTIQTNAQNATIGGGTDNTVSGSSAIVSGGLGNSAVGAYTTVAGGHLNIARFSYDAVSGGFQNMAAGVISVVGGGAYNTNNGNGTVVAGGAYNRGGASGAVIGGGWDNFCNGSFATIPGGRSNETHGAYSLVAGYRAKTIYDGSFVWADWTEADIAATNGNSVTMRASGGYRLFTDSTATAGAFLAAGSGSWTSMSDRNAKEKFAPVDSQAVLAKVVALPMTTWKYKSQDIGVRHIGPMAQDFKSAFGVGESSTGISTVDADGVALAAIQGLNQKLEETRAENSELRKRLAELEQVVQRLDTR